MGGTITHPKTRPGVARRWLQTLIDSPPDTDDCVLWPFSVKTCGYGQVRWDGKVAAPTRIVLESVQGPPPPEPRIEAAHAPEVCHNPLCVNPRHLRWANPTDNAADRLLDGTHARGEQNPSAKLVAKQVLAIYSSAAPTRILADEYGVSAQCVRAIRSGRRWGWLTGAQREVA